ncbi:MAG: hypothetical protein KR126chlam6_00316, partial [Candidatus Anoxychlamydiales bacterium]|nr:hypothetical protein [Candidatus Anoxychlamydiales bacterium]
LAKTLDEYLTTFEPLDTKTYVGKIDKIDLENDSKLVLKADLHGDFEALENHLKTLQKNGYLDENLKVVDKYKDKIQIAFLGDYLDRGDKSFKIIDLLMKLKMKNPNEVILLRGNHEYLLTSYQYIHPNERHFYRSKELCHKLDKFFSTLSLACFIGAKDEKGIYQYTLLTHGAIEPDLDLNELLSKKEKRASILFRKDKKFSLSDRITNILPKKLRKDNSSSDDFEDVIKALKDFIASQSSKNKKEVQKFVEGSIDKKRAKLILSTLRIQDFLNCKLIAEVVQEERKKSTTSFNWGDIKEKLGYNCDRGAGLTFTPEFIKDYFRAISSDTRKVKTLRAGHAHAHIKFSLDGKKDFIEILPVAGNLEFYDVVRKPVDSAQIITVQSGKVKKWTKNTLKRDRDAENTRISSEKTFYKTKAI